MPVKDPSNHNQSIDAFILPAMNAAEDGKGCVKFLKMTRDEAENLLTYWRHLERVDLVGYSARIRSMGLAPENLTNRLIVGSNDILTTAGDVLESIAQLKKFISHQPATHGELNAEFLFRLQEFKTFKMASKYLKDQILKNAVMVKNTRGTIYFVGATMAGVVAIELSKKYMSKPLYDAIESYTKPFLSTLLDGPIGDVLNAAALAQFGLPGLASAGAYLAYSAKSRYDSYAHQKRMDAIFGSVRYNPDSSLSSADDYRNPTLSFLQTKLLLHDKKNNASSDESPQFFITASPEKTASISAPGFNDDCYDDIPATNAGSQLPSILLSTPINPGAFTVIRPKEILMDALNQTMETNDRSRTLAPPVKHDIFLADVSGQTLKQHQEKVATIHAANQGKMTHSGGIYVTPDGKPGAFYSGSYKTDSNHHITLGAGIDISGRRSVSLGTNDPKIGAALFVGYFLIQGVRRLIDSEKNYQTIPGITNDSEKTRGLTKILNKFSGKPATVENIQALKAAVAEFRSHLLYSDFIQGTEQSEPTLRFDGTVENKSVKTLSGQDVFDGLLYRFTEGAKKTIPNINEITSEKLVEMTTGYYAYCAQKEADAQAARRKQIEKHNALVAKFYNAGNIVSTLNAISAAQKELHNPEFLKLFSEELCTSEGCDAHAHRALIDKNLVAAREFHAKAQTLRGEQYSNAHATADSDFALRLAETGNSNEAKNAIDVAITKGISEHIDSGSLRELYVSAIDIERNKSPELQNTAEKMKHAVAILKTFSDDAKVDSQSFHTVCTVFQTSVGKGFDTTIAEETKKMQAMSISPQEKMETYRTQLLMEHEKPLQEQKTQELISVLKNISGTLKEIPSDDKEYTKLAADLKGFASSDLLQLVTAKSKEDTYVARNEAFKMLQEVHSSLSNEKPSHEFCFTSKPPTELKHGRVDFTQDDSGKLKYSTILPDGKEIRDQSLNIETSDQLTLEQLQAQKEKILGLLAKNGHISQLTHKDISTITLAQWHCERLEFTNAAEVISNQLTKASASKAPDETIAQLQQQYENTVSQQVQSYQLGLSAVSKAVDLMLDTMNYEVVPVAEFPQKMEKNKVYARQINERVEYITIDMKESATVEASELKLKNKSILDIVSERGHIFNIDYLRRIRNGCTFASSAANAYFSDILKKMKLNPKDGKNLCDYLSPKAFFSHLTDKCKNFKSGNFNFKEGFGHVNGALFFINMCANMLSQEISKEWSEKDKKALQANLGYLDAATNTSAFAHSFTHWHELYSNGYDKLVEGGCLNATTTLAGVTYGTLLPAASIVNYFCEFDKKRAEGNAPTSLAGIALEESCQFIRHPYVSASMFTINNAPTVYAWGNAGMLWISGAKTAAAAAAAAATVATATVAGEVAAGTATVAAGSVAAATGEAAASGATVTEGAAAVAGYSTATIVAGVVIVLFIGYCYYSYRWYQNQLHNIKTKLDQKTNGYQNRLDAQKAVNEILNAWFLKTAETEKAVNEFKKQIEAENARVAAAFSETQKEYESTQKHWTRILQGEGEEGAFVRFLTTFSEKENIANMQERFSVSNLAKIKADILTGRMYAPRAELTKKSIQDYCKEMHLCLSAQEKIHKEIESIRNARKKEKEYIADIVKKADASPDEIANLQKRSKEQEDLLDALEKKLSACDNALKICFSNCAQLSKSSELTSLSELVAQRQIESIHELKVDTAIELAGTASVLLTHTIADYFKGERQRESRFPDWSFAPATPARTSKASSLFQTTSVKKNKSTQSKETVSTAKNSVLFSLPKKEKSTPTKGMRYAIH